MSLSDCQAVGTTGHSDFLSLVQVVSVVEVAEDAVIVRYTGFTDLFSAFYTMNSVDSNH